MNHVDVIHNFITLIFKQMYHFANVVILTIVEMKIFMQIREINFYITISVHKKYTIKYTTIFAKSVKMIDYKTYAMEFGFNVNYIEYSFERVTFMNFTIMLF